MEASEFANNLRKLGTTAEEIVFISLDAGIDQLDADLTNRVFNDNVDIYGQPFGKYKSEAYKLFRLRLGRQIANKDFQLFGNLKKSINKNYKEKQLEFNSQLQADKGRGQEDQLNALIFEASDEEVTRSVQAIEEEYEKRITKIFE